VKAALDAAKVDRFKQLRIAGEFIRGESLPIGEPIRAGTFILKFLEKLERQKRRRPSKDRGFRVLRLIEAEMINSNQRRKKSPCPPTDKGVKRI